MTTRLILWATLALIMTAVPTWAERNTSDRLNERFKKLTAEMNDAQQEQMAKIQVAFGTLQAVGDVRIAMDRAIKSCVQANPDLAPTMTTAFQGWKNTILPVTRRGQNRLDKMILSQSATKPQNIRDYLDEMKKIMREQTARFPEVPISARGDCETLVKNMNTSSKTLSRLISETIGLEESKTP
jgi:Spy/CpxP family protein refolding chaperone